jgi:dTDP-4-dehydrorhamnose reductase
MRVVVIGANGQLGGDVCEEFRLSNDMVLELNHSQVDISDFEALKSILGNITPDVVVNTAAMHNVEACELKPFQAFLVNGEGARNLAILSNELNFVLCHISTDYVFDGRRRAPYVETDMPLPLNVYGNTKLSGEFFIRSIARKHFVIRTSALYGRKPCRAKGGLNFVRLMLKLAREGKDIRVVDDERITPTYTRDLARQIAILSKSSYFGLYHATAQGSCSWYEFARVIFDISRLGAKPSIADPSEFPAKVARPKYSVLENQNLKLANLDAMPHWEESLNRYMEEDIHE